MCIGFATYAQLTLSGRITDKADKGPLQNATIVVLNKDSILQQFTRADENGKFQFKNMSIGNYRLLVTYPKFEVFSQDIDLKENITLADVEINSQQNVIEEVLIKAKLPITMKGDTTEYDAGSFETEKNAKVEDLLRRLPGISVSADGAITAQGKSVSKVLIDGEEFFGYDPKIAIRNVRADAVDKVQVYERKSEQSEMTGIDDGVRLQTVNVKLKEEAKVGVFGNLEALYGTENLFTTNLFAAKFNQSERIGITANINNMGSSGREGGIRMNNQITGEPHSSSIGANYDNNFLKKRLTLSSSYNFNDNGNKNESESFSKQLLPDDKTLETTNKSTSESHNQNNSLRAQSRFRIDSTQNMEIQLGANLSKNSSESTSNSSSVNGDSSPASTSDLANQSSSENQSSEIRINYRKQLPKKGQSLNVFVSNNNTTNNTESSVFEEAYSYADDSRKNVDQQRLGRNLDNNVSGQLSFNNWISDKINYSIGYNINNSYSSNLLNAYNREDQLVSDQLDSAYSQNQKDINTNHGANISIRYTYNKLNINVNNRLNYKIQGLEDEFHTIDLQRDFWDNNLNMDVNYRISNAKNLRISYQNSSIVPTFNQLQPTQPQTSEFFQQLGNPDLKRAFNNSIRMNYGSSSMMKGTSLNLNGDLSFVNNPIVNQRTIDENTKTTSTFLNVEGKTNWTARANANFSKSLLGNSIQLNHFANLNYSNSYGYINTELNNEQNSNAAVGVAINEQNSTGFDYDISGNIGLNNQLNSVNKDFNDINFRGGGNGNIKYFLPKKFNISFNVVYDYTAATKLYTKEIHQFYTNIEASKKLLKSESLVASIKVFDLFNTYNNTNRNTSNTAYSESTQLVLTQYILVGLKWDFNKNLGKKND